MDRLTTTDRTERFYKNWGSGQPIVFKRDRPLSDEDWDRHMLFVLRSGCRVMARDRRGHGRSSQTGAGHGMNHYADDLPAVTAHLDLSERHPCRSLDRRREVVRYTARHGESGVATAALISAAPPLMVQTDANPDGLPNGVFDVYQPQPAAKRAVFYRDVASGPFYGFNRPGVELSEVIIDNWVHQGMMGAAKAHYDGIVASTQTDFTEDLKKITAPVLVMHRADDQIVPYSDSAPLSAKLVQKGTLKIYEGSRTACLPATLRRSATISWPGCSPDRTGRPTVSRA